MIEEKRLDNGFPLIEVRNAHATARIAPQGAQVLHFQRRGQAPLLWQSRASRFERGRPFRGGVPLCWPWFGPHPEDPGLPQHGFARTAPWRMTRARQEEDGTDSLFLELTDSEATRALWPHRFSLELRVSIGADLRLALTTVNQDRQSLVISAALHAYFLVSHIDKVCILGLEGTRYLDKVTGREGVQQGALRITGETDRVFQDTGDLIELRDSGRRILLRPEGSRSTVVWNPWATKCARMGDMEPQGYSTMVCVETANALDDARRLEPGEGHCLGVVISTEDTD